MRETIGEKSRDVRVGVREPRRVRQVPVRGGQVGGDPTPRQDRLPLLQHPPGVQREHGAQTRQKGSTGEKRKHFW